MKTICFDYDGTYTEFPTLCLKMMREAERQGHRVIMATMRYPEEVDSVLESLERLYLVYYTSRKAKRSHLATLGILVDLWIDDQPEFIVADALSFARKE